LGGVFACVARRDCVACVGVCCAGIESSWYSHPALAAPSSRRQAASGSSPAEAAAEGDGPRNGRGLLQRGQLGTSVSGHGVVSRCWRISQASMHSTCTTSGCVARLSAALQTPSVTLRCVALVWRSAAQARGCLDTSYSMLCTAHSLYTQCSRGQLPRRDVTERTVGGRGASTGARGGGARCAEPPESGSLYFILYTVYFIL